MFALNARIVICGRSVVTTTTVKKIPKNMSAFHEDSEQPKSVLQYLYHQTTQSRAAGGGGAAVAEDKSSARGAIFTDDGFTDVEIVCAATQPLSPPMTAANSGAGGGDSKSKDRKSKTSAASKMDGKMAVVLRAHKCVLAASSQKMKKMFCESDVMESGSGGGGGASARGVVRKVLSSPAAAVMSQVLTFIYTGRLDTTSPEELIDVSAAAEQFDLVRLNDFCLSSVKEKLRPHELVRLWSLCVSASSDPNAARRGISTGVLAALSAASGEQIATHFDAVIRLGYGVKSAISLSLRLHCIDVWSGAVVRLSCAVCVVP